MIFHPKISPGAILAIALILSLFTSLPAAYRSPVWSKNGMVATPHKSATEAAVAMLESGGNAVDACVAAAFALSVVEQYHSGLGGGEFTLLRMVDDGRARALDARESAPTASTRDMFLDPETGKPVSYSWIGGKAAGVPGSVAGRVELIEKYGNLSLDRVISPSIELARDGFRVDRYMAARLAGDRDRFAETKATAETFFHESQPYQRGEILTQRALARTLKTIARDKGKSFYHGDHAEAIAAACRANAGVMTAEDLAQYKFVWRDPVEFEYRGHTIYSMPPPSSGGPCLALIHNILEEYPLSLLDRSSADAVHLIASAFELAFADRAVWLGDPAYTPQPVGGMSSEAYAAKRRKLIDRHFRTPVESRGDPWTYDDDSNTSHISVIDKAGNMCAMTTSVNSAFGSKVFVPELGIFLNSTMNDFALAPDEPNKWNLVGAEVNQIEPGKRPLSSMSPTLVLKDGEPFLAVGSVGGPRIITSIAHVLINLIDYDMSIQAAIDAPRVHMQWRPDLLYLEEEFPGNVANRLRQMGWTVKTGGHWSLSQAVLINQKTGEFFGASDARGVGSAGPAED